MGGIGLGPSQKANRLSGPLHGWNGHDHFLVPSTGGVGTAVRRFPARAKRGLEEERCAATGKRRGGGGQRKEEKKRREEKSVAWRRSATLLQAREEEEEDK